MVVPAVSHGAAWGADGKPAAVELVPRAIPELGCFVHDLDKESRERRGGGGVATASREGAGFMKRHGGDSILFG